ncbi:MAG: molybdopterin-dependent oxidoreductase [Deltaproteobacteria bacterium]|nr:molybdopterin-dependent oxidoreductase [Deltaproteobacteria bacterium]
MATEIVKSVCGLCSGSCGVLITIKDGKPFTIKGNPEIPTNRGGLCKIGLASLEYLNHPDRLKHPLKRSGKRGEGKWKKITWEEAFSLVSGELIRVKQGYGPESVVMAHGSAKGFMDTHLVRLANAFGTPNVVCSDHVCHVPRMLAAELTFGFLPAADYGYPPACIMVWGANMATSHSNIFRNFSKALKAGSKVIVIDPLKTGIAGMSDLWLQIKPGTDLSLALGILNVIISDELYDKDFVSQWTVGFGRLKAHVKQYTVDKVSETTWIPSERIQAAARMFATQRPGHIEWGNAIDHQRNSFQAARAISMIMALTGNLGVPGGELERLGSGFREADPDKYSSQIRLRGRWSHELELRHLLSPEARKKKLDPGLLPDFRYVTPQAVVKSVLEEDPYSVRAMFVTASNPLSSWPNIKKTIQAFRKLDFLAVSDMFITPTAAMADVIFPAASYMEFDAVQMPPPGHIAQMQRKVAQVGECRSDHEIINGLAHKLGIGKHFWKRIDDFWNAILEPSGLTLEEFKKMDHYTGDKKARLYKKYEDECFKTPSGKVELYSSQLEDLGFDPLPVYYEPPEGHDLHPDFAKQYPLLCTTWKLALYRHSGGRQIPSLRGLHPEPRAIIHPETARTRDIDQGDWVWIESPRGKIRQKAKLSHTVNPRVVVADHAWWFPEKGEQDLFGLDESNYNVLTNDQPPFSSEVGSFTIRGVACEVSKAINK